MNYSKLFFLFIAFLFYGVSFSQSETFLEKKDSLLYYLNNAKGKSQLKDLKKAADLAKELQIDSLIRQTNIKYGIQSYFKKQAKGLDTSQKNLYQLYLKSQDSFALAKVYHYKALIHLIKLNKDSSFYYYHLSKNISIKIMDSLEVGRRLLSMANMQREEKDYLGSEITAIEGLRFLEPLKEYKYTGNLYNNIGIVLNETKRYEEARKYYYKSIEVNKKNPLKRRKEIANLNLLNNIGRSFYREKKYKESILYFTKALNFDSIKIKYPYQYRMLMENLSYSQDKLGNKKEALKGYLEVLNAREKINNIFGLASSHTMLSYFYTNNKKKIYHGKKGLEYARKAKLKRRVLECLEILTRLTKGEESKRYFKEYIQLNNRLSQRERSLKNQFAKVRYETEKKEKENTILKIENERKQLQIAKEKQQKIISWLIAFGLLLLFGFSTVIYRIRRKKMTFEAQLQKAEVREQERQQIAKSLHDEVAGDIRVLHQQLEKSNQLEIAQKLDIVKNNVRNLSHQLSSIQFEKVSFKNQIVNLISDYFSTDCKIMVSGLKEIDWKSIKNPIKRTLYLCTRECLQNTQKYAKAKKVTLQFHQNKNNLSLAFKDDGIGFDIKTRFKGIGLKNLKERVEELNGKVEINSTINKGTTIEIEIPVNA